jgi:KDO2-lipid IV(A) lauroyltransferase
MLSKLLYYIIILPISKLPFALLYRLSDVVFFLVYYIFPYRKKVVVQNLRIAFPDKSEQEIKHICKKFYAHFCDIIFETIKVFSLNKTDLQKHFNITNPESLDKFKDINKSVVLVTGHYNNWEWAALAFSTYTTYKTMGIFKPLSNAFFNQVMIDSRGKFGCALCAPKQVGSFIESHKNELFAYGFIADQNPSDKKRGHWMEFFGKQVPVNFGLEKFAKQYDMPVVYANITKVKRGYYEMTYHELTSKPTDFEQGKICELFMKSLEHDIKVAPEFWLWTHKRWKHSPGI